MYLVEEQSVIFLKSFLVAEVNIVGGADSFNHSLWLWLSCGYNYRTNLLHTSTVDDHYEEADKLCQDKKGGLVKMQVVGVCSQNVLH